LKGSKAGRPDQAGSSLVMDGEQLSRPTHCQWTETSSESGKLVRASSPGHTTLIIPGVTRSRDQWAGRAPSSGLHSIGEFPGRLGKGGVLLVIRIRAARGGRLAWVATRIETEPPCNKRTNVCSESSVLTSDGEVIRKIFQMASFK
jgi:hypothetical protein